MEEMDLTEFEKRLIAMEKIIRELKEKALILSEVLKSGNVANGEAVEQVAFFISDQIRLVDDKLIVVNAEGQTRLNKNAECVSVKELVAEFLINNPHFKKGGG